MSFWTISAARAWLIMLATVIAFGSCVSAEIYDIAADLDRLATLEGSASKTAADSIRTRISSDTAGIVAALLPKLSAATNSEKQLALYVWALGLAQSPAAVEGICRTASETKSDLVRSNCWSALVLIGDDQSEACLLSSLDYLTEKNARFELFSALGQLQSATAIPLAQEVLACDAKEWYWQPIFVFGKMGDIAVPFLLTKIQDENTDVRYNAINVLGQWFLAPEATQPLKDQFWKEKDSYIRNLILGSLEMIDPDIDSLTAFMRRVKSKSDDMDSRKFAEETIEMLKSLSKEIGSLEEMKRVSPEAFEEAYRQIWDSYGREGGYESLFAASQLDDEARLKKLRERILQRNSDEALYDYKKINQTIYANRLLFSHAAAPKK
jgi:hypothetical protein